MRDCPEANKYMRACVYACGCEHITWHSRRGSLTGQKWSKDNQGEPLIPTSINAHGFDAHLFLCVAAFVHYVSTLKSVCISLFFTSTYIGRNMGLHICRNGCFYTSRHHKNNCQMMQRKKQKKKILQCNTGCGLLGSGCNLCSTILHLWKVRQPISVNNSKLMVGRLKVISHFHKGSKHSALLVKNAVFWPVYGFSFSLNPIKILKFRLAAS